MPIPEHSGPTEAIITGVLKREGGFQQNPNDLSRGATNMGITQATLASWRGNPVSVDDVRSLTADEARAIYRKRYVEDPGFDKFASDDLCAAMVDIGVNSGPVQAVKLLQRALGVTEDGLLGPATMKAVATCPNLVKKLATQRAWFYLAIVDKDETQKIFLRGWIARAIEMA